jgi:hypothetical protein
MPRPKGPGAIRFLNPKTQDAVAMRRTLWRGDRKPTPCEDKLNQLYTERAKLTVRLIGLRTERARCCGKLDVAKRENHPTGQAFARAELRRVETKISSAEASLLKAEEQIKETSKQQTTEARRRSRAVFSWQEKAMQLIELYGYLHKKEHGSVVPSTQGATIPTRVLQEQLRAAGFKVGDRELRRFMRRIGVAGKQGKRTDLRKSFALVATLFVLALSQGVSASAQEIRRATYADKWRSLPHENTWQWLVRTGMCMIGGCERARGGLAYMNWGEAQQPVYDNIEVKPDEILLAPYPFKEPAPDNLPNAREFRSPLGSCNR